MQIRKWQLLVTLLTPLAHAEETTTNNLLDNNAWTASGGVLDYTIRGYMRTDWTGGEIVQTIDLSAYENQSQYNYSTTAYGCNNSYGGYCSNPNGIHDTVVVSLVTDTGDNWTDEFSINYGANEIDITYTPTADATSAELTVYGIDEGYWAGWYGPVIFNGNFTVTFDPTLTEAIIPAANPELNTVLPADPMSDPSMGMSVPDVVPVEIPTPTVEIQTPVAQPVQQTQSTQQTQPTQQEQRNDVLAPNPSVNASNASGSSNSSSSSRNKSSSKVSVRTATGVVNANIDVATASASSIGNAFGDPSDPVAQAVMVAVMASNGANLTEAKLKQPKLPKELKLKNKKIGNRFWLDSLRSEVRFQKHMVDKQWQK